MEWLWIICALVCAWATLRIIAGERQRRVNDLLVELANSPAQPNGANDPVRSKAAR
jgi:hypothetical protein